MSRRALIALAAALAAGAGAPARARGQARKLLCLGDSLTAGYMLPPGQGFVPVLAARLKARGVDVEMIAAGVSGDTAAGGLERLDWALGDGADAAIVELGANDMFRGADPARVEKALDAIVVKLQARKVRVLLAGMRASPGLGREYGERFDAIYPAIARRRDVPLYPFFLEGVAADPALNLSDGMHPNKAGVEIIVAGILPMVEKLLRGEG